MTLYGYVQPCHDYRKMQKIEDFSIHSSSWGRQVPIAEMLCKVCFQTVDAMMSFSHL